MTNSVAHLRQHTSDYLAHGCCVVLAVVFVLSSTPKLMNSHHFLEGVYAYALVSAKVGLLIASTLPMTELVIAVALLSGLFRDGALVLTVLMSLVYTAANVSVLWRGLSISCSCFGSDHNGDMVTWLTVFRSLGLGGVAVVAMMASDRGKKYD